MIAVHPRLKSITDHDGIVILDIEHDTMTALDTIGAYVWERLARGQGVNAIVADLVRDTGAATDVVAKDINEFMEQLKSRRLVTYSDDGSAGTV